MKRPLPMRLRNVLDAALWAALGLAAIAGCEKPSATSSDAPQTAQTTTPAPPAETQPAASGDLAGQPLAPANSQGDGGSDAPPSKPPPIAADVLNKYQIPEGSAEEILDFADRMESAFRGTMRQSQLTEMSEEELKRQVTELISLKRKAAEKVLAMQDVQPEQRRRAAGVQMEALTMLTGLDDSFAAQLRKAADDLLQNQDEQVSAKGRMALFMLDINQLASGELEDPTVLDANFEKILLNKQINDQEFTALCRGVGSLFQSEEHKEASVAYLTRLAETFKTSENQDLAKSAAQLATELQSLGFQQFVFDAMQRKPGSTETLAKAANDLVAAGASIELFQELTQYATNLEFSGNLEAAKSLYEILRQAYVKHENPKLAEAADDMLQKVDIRLGLVGKPLSAEGASADGSPFNWADYQGKVVLLDFWATWCGPCLAEVPNLKANYEKYHASGFEILGINLDDDAQAAAKYLQANPLPWKTLVSSNPEQSGFSNPMAVRCGVEAIPFILLIGRDGNVLALHLRDERLGEELAKLFPQAATTPEPAGPQPNPPAAAPAKGADDASSWLPTPGAAYFVSVVEDDQNPSETADEAVDDDPLILEQNPYLARADLTDVELIEFLLDMQEKPKSIQRRAGFTEAVVEAADRVLKSSKRDKFQTIACLEKFRVLHAEACLGNQDADKRLMEFVEHVRLDARPRIAKEVAFLSLEREAIDAEDIPLEKLPELLDKLARFFENEKLEQKHLRIASSTVHAINRIENGEQRQKHFQQFGDLFAKSADKQLSHYGKKIAKTNSAESSDLVGKPLEITGANLAGAPIDWNSYRGKVVLVDFWATWCGPCLREMPQVRALYDKLHDRGFEVVGVSLDADLEALTKYVEENGIPWETLAGEENQALANKYGVRGIPAMFLVDQKGEVVGVSHHVAALAPRAEQLLSKAVSAK